MGASKNLFDGEEGNSDGSIVGFSRAFAIHELKDGVSVEVISATRTVNVYCHGKFEGAEVCLQKYVNGDWFDICHIKFTDNGIENFIPLERGTGYRFNLKQIGTGTRVKAGYSF